MAQEKGIATRSADYGQWYLDVIEKGGLVDDSPVRGCKVLKPHGYAIWENIQRDLDARFKETGHVNAYFPLFIPVSFLSKEAEHVEGFAKECAVVTHHRLRGKEGGGVEPDPDSLLEEPLVVRPTSETMIWHMYGRWIDSWRDLPILINQWANVVRWEMKTRPFLRTTEFLWQEGHTAHANAAEAQEETRRMLDVYATFCEDFLAVPVVRGEKSARERFAGAVETWTIEAMMQNGWALQAGTSHFLGQNFARAFDVTFQSEAGTRDHVWATSWGVSTRLIGAVVMTHSDDAGLVLPPKVAPVQVVVIPVYKSAEERTTVMAAVNALFSDLKGRFRVKVDDRDNLRPGAKYFEWEQKGVPLRLEVGPRDVDAGAFVLKSRYDGSKTTIKLEEVTPGWLRGKLEAAHELLYRRALTFRENNTRRANTYDELKQILKEHGGFVRCYFKPGREQEARIKDQTKATVRCIPFDQPGKPGKCVYTGEETETEVLFALAY